jgi:hypothetical protein
MSETHDVFLRAHTAVPNNNKNKKKRGSGAESPWPDRVVVYDCETLTDATLKLTFGAYRICKLVDGHYLCEEEGLFYPDHLSSGQRKVLVQYVKAENVYADIEVKSFTPKIRLQLMSRSEFAKTVFFKAIQDKNMIVGFNLPFDLARIAEDWAYSDGGGHSLILLRWHDRKSDGQLKEDTYYPRIIYKALNSKTALIRSTQVRKIREEGVNNNDTDKPKAVFWPHGRFLDVRTLLWALRNVSYSLKRACKELETEHQKKDHAPTGKITRDEIEYCLWDVKCTVEVLNKAKAEYDLHPIDRRPDQLYSPASVAKGYMDALKITYPCRKFRRRNHAFGIAMQAYYGGRAECRIRKCEVPVVPVDFMSQYPTVNELLGNWEMLIAEHISFEETTDEVREFLHQITLEKCFDPRLWRDFKFFALVKPEEDILPVRTLYNDVTQNIGINYLTSRKPIWYAGPDLISAIILSDGKVPQIEKAYRVVPQGKQSGLGKTNLRGMVKVDAKNSLYKHVIEQRTENESNKALHYWLKILANSGSYGLFVELNPNANTKHAEIKVCFGEETFRDRPSVLEEPGDWFAPPIASLITAGGRLLLAMLESTVKKAGGTYLFCDTDSLAIVASEQGGPLNVPGTHGERVLSWDDVDRAVKRFESLNPYNQEIEGIRGSILKVHKRNWNGNKERRQLYGYSVAGKRYALYEKKNGDIEIVEPKAHGLGYFYPPKDSPDRWEKDHDVPKWIFELWDYIVRGALGMRRRRPSWFELPVMMKIMLSAPHHALQNLGKCDLTRPHNFMMMPKIAPFGYPPGINPADPHFTLITRFTNVREDWIKSECINIHDCESPTYRLKFDYTDDGVSASPVNFYQLAESYQNHPEAKSLGPDGKACEFDTRGLLGRAQVLPGEHVPIGKESDRHWDEGDINVLEFKTIRYQRRGKVVATLEQLRRIEQVPKREFMRRDINQHTLEKVCKRIPVWASKLAKVLKVLQEWETEQENLESSAPVNSPKLRG